MRQGVLGAWLGTGAGREEQQAAAQTCLGMCWLHPWLP